MWNFLSMMIMNMRNRSLFLVYDRKLLIKWSYRLKILGSYILADRLLSFNWTLYSSRKDSFLPVPRSLHQIKIVLKISYFRPFHRIGSHHLGLSRNHQWEKCGLLEEVLEPYCIFWCEIEIWKNKNRNSSPPQKSQ